MKKTHYGKKALAMILSLLMVVGITTTGLTFALAADAKFQDSASHWAVNDIEKWGATDIIKGYTDGTFRPEKKITRAEFATMLQRLLGYPAAEASFDDVKAGDWYAADIGALQAAGIMKGSNGKVRPNDTITREEASALLARAFKLSTNGTPNFADNDKISASSDFAGAAAAMQKKGYITGKNGNMFDPKGELKRCEMVTILSRIATNYAEGETVDSVVAGNLFIKNPNTVVTGVTVTGDVIIAPNVGDGDVDFNDVKVEGTVFVMGGGKNSVKFSNCRIAEIRITKDEVRIVFAGGGVTTIKAANVGGLLELDNVEIENLSVESEGIEVSLGEGTAVENVFVESAETKISVDENAAVKTLVANSGVEVTGAGVVETAIVQAENVSFETAPAKTEATEGVKVVVAGEETVGTGVTVEIPKLPTPVEEEPVVITPPVVVPPVTPTTPPTTEPSTTPGTTTPTTPQKSTTVTATVSELAGMTFVVIAVSGDTPATITAKATVGGVATTTNAVKQANGEWRFVFDGIVTGSITYTYTY